MSRALSMLAFALCALAAQGVAAVRVPSFLAVRRLLQDDDHGSTPHGVTVGNRHYLNLNATQIRGVYEGLGQNYPESVWQAFFTEEFPNCNNNKSVVNWEHHGPTDRPMVTISAHGDDAGRYVEAHHRGTYGARILSYNNSVLELVELGEGEKYCVHMQPYVDMLTGEMMMSSVTMALWTRDNATAPNVYTDLTCDYVAGNEKPGCYLADIARYQSTPEVEARAAEFDAADMIANRPSGSVISVAVAKYLCRNGECAASSPVYARIDAEHEE